MNIRRRFIQIVLPLVPNRVTLPIITGPARGMWWKRDACNHCFWLGTYERPKCEMLVRECGGESVFYDIGANSGYYSLIASRSCKQVVAFEPFPRNVARFKSNMRLNHRSNVTLIEAAVSDCAAELRFRSGENTEIGRLDEAGDIVVKSVRLDDLLGQLPPPSIMKMDVEGAELTALLGARQTLRQAHPVIFLATHGDEVHRDCLELLKAENYQIQVLQADEIVAR